MTLTDQVLEACILRPGPWPAAPKTCVWCATTLVGRQRRWCTGGCEREFTRQHQWASARSAAIARDGGGCTRCGSTPEWPEADAAIKLIRLWCPPPQPPTLREFAAEHRGWTPNATRLQWTDHARALRRQWRDAQAPIDAERRQRQLEVNHRVPILGRHAEFGCHHHLDGLETLCHRCHVQETARQFGYRTALDPAQQELDVA